MSNQKLTISFNFPLIPIFGLEREDETALNGEKQS